MAKKLGGNKNYPEMIDLFSMKKPYEGYFVRSDFVQNDKVEGSYCHVFNPIDGSTEREEALWGCGSLDYALFDKKTNLTKVETGTPLRIQYNGKQEAKVRIGKKMVTKEIHAVDVFDISDEMTDKE